MFLINKFVVELHPSTTDVAYCSAKVKEINFSSLLFKDGSVRVVCDSIADIVYANIGSSVHIQAYITSMDDLMVVAQIKDIIENNTKYPLSFVLMISSPVYSRYDRVMLDDKSDSFGAKVFANFVNSLGFDAVSYLDCHSDVLTNLSNKAFSFEQKDLLKLSINVDNYSIVAPDKGALVKNPNADIVFNKVRDLGTGKIKGLELVKQPITVEDNIIVVDDLCEGGGTFIGVAKSIQQNFSYNSLSLYITHGLLTNNAVSKLKEFYSNIFVHIMKESVYNTLQDDEKEIVIPFLLVKEI